MDKCVYHDEIKLTIDKLVSTIESSQKWQSAWQANLENMNYLLREVREDQKKLTETINNLIIDAHKNFITKKEFDDFKVVTKRDIDTIREIAPKLTLKSMAIIFSMGSGALAFIQWSISLLLGR